MSEFKNGSFELYSSNVNKFIKQWLDPKIQSRNNESLFLEVLAELQSSALRKYTLASRKSPEYFIQDALAGSAFYSQEIINEHLSDTINDYFYLQQNKPEKLRTDLINELIHQVKHLAMECFITGLAAGNYGLLPYEDDLVVANNKRKELQKHNDKRHEITQSGNKSLMEEAKDIIKKINANPTLSDETKKLRTKNKAFIAKKVIENLELKSTGSDINHVTQVARKITPIFKTPPTD